MFLKGARLCEILSKKIFNGFPNSQRLKNKWEQFLWPFTVDLTDFEKKNAIPTFQEDVQELIRLLEAISKGEDITDFIKQLKNHYNDSTPNNLPELERYVEKMKEHCSQVKYLIDRILRKDPCSQNYNIQALEKRIRRNIDVWYRQRSELNCKIFSILLEERKICYANRILFLEILAVIIGILFAVKIF